MKLFDDKAQAGGIVMLVLGILIVGFIYVAFSAMMYQIWDVNNDIISTDKMHYSLNHWNSMNELFKYWWAVPIFSVIIFLIYAIRNALTKAPGEV